MFYFSDSKIKDPDISNLPLPSKKKKNTKQNKNPF